MDFEVWKEPGKTGRTYHVFYGLKTSDEIYKALKETAKDRKCSTLPLYAHTGYVVKGKELWIDGYKKGARNAIVVTRG